MHTSDAYAALVQELEAVKQLSAPDLLALVDAPPSRRDFDISGERIEIEVSVAWRDNTRRSVRITGHARGPSTWRTEHLQESITVPVLMDEVDWPSP